MFHHSLFIFAESHHVVERTEQRVVLWSRHLIELQQLWGCLRGKLSQLRHHSPAHGCVKFLIHYQNNMIFIIDVFLLLSLACFSLPRLIAAAQISLLSFFQPLERTTQGEVRIIYFFFASLKNTHSSHSNEQMRMLCHKNKNRLSFCRVNKMNNSAVLPVLFSEFRLSLTPSSLAHWNYFKLSAEPKCLIYEIVNK
jgi:hypothetical protein